MDKYPTDKYNYYFQTLNAKRKWEGQTWQRFHYKAYQYPNFPTEHDKASIVSFYKEIFPKEIVCGICVGHYTDICDITIDDAVNSSVLLEWTQKLHNAVNIKLGKDIFTESIKDWFDMGFFNLPDNQDQVTIMRNFLKDPEEIKIFQKLYPEGSDNKEDFKSEVEKIVDQTLPLPVEKRSMYTKIFASLSSLMIIIVLACIIYKKIKRKN